MVAMNAERQWCLLNPVSEGQEDLPHLIPLVFGDWSNDGGGETERVYCWSNLSLVAWREALLAGCELLDVDLLHDCASQWQDSTMPLESLQKLRTAGFDKEIECEPEEDLVEVNFDEFKAMVFFAIQKGNPDIRFVEIDHGPWSVELHPGGYGLLTR